MAKTFGATDAVSPGGHALREIMAMTGGVGVDYAFEVIGLPATIETCVKAARRAAWRCWSGWGGRKSGSR